MDNEEPYWGKLWTWDSKGQIASHQVLVVEAGIVDGRWEFVAQSGDDGSRFLRATGKKPRPGDMLARTILWTYDKAECVTLPARILSVTPSSDESAVIHARATGKPKKMGFDLRKGKK